MKKLKATIIFLLFFSFCYAQGNMFYYRDSETNYYHIFGDKVNIRSEPDKDSEVLKLVQIGDSIKVNKITDINFELNGMTYPWVEVQWVHNKKQQKGYIWGGLFSFYHESFTILDGTEYSLYFGPLKYETSEKKLYGEARLCKNQNIIDNGIFELNLNNNRERKLDMGTYKEPSEHPSEYRTIEHITSLNLTVESCGPTGRIYVLIKHGKIIFSGSEIGSYSGGDYSKGNEFVFPWDKGGMKEKIFEYFSIYESGGDDYSPAIMDTTYLVNTYTIVNDKFIKIKK